MKFLPQHYSSFLHHLVQSSPFTDRTGSISIPLLSPLLPRLPPNMSTRNRNSKSVKSKSGEGVFYDGGSAFGYLISKYDHLRMFILLLGRGNTVTTWEDPYVWLTNAGTPSPSTKDIKGPACPARYNDPRGDLIIKSREGRTFKVHMYSLAQER